MNIGWKHYGCGWQKDVDLKDIGLEDEIRDRWENGGGAAGDGIVDDLERLICEDGKRSGRCSGGQEEAGKCRDPALVMPRTNVGSPTYCKFPLKVCYHVYVHGIFMPIIIYLSSFILGIGGFGL
jgi:hypothetical protein